MRAEESPWGRAGFEVPINPPPSLLGRTNAIVAGRARRYHVASFPGPLSLKSVVRGLAAWTTAAGRFEIEPGAVLLLNDGEEYSLEVDSLQPVETFCLFFARGYVEEAWQAIVTSSDRLLDRPDGVAPHFFERLDHGALGRSVETARRAARHGWPVEPWFARIARQVVLAERGVAERIGRLPAVRAATREELRRRAGRAVEFMHASLAEPLSLETVARMACLSPFHFHRVFTALYGATPHAYLTRLRLARAATLLRSGRNVNQTAIDCGFASPTSFSSLFRREFGVSPGRFGKNRESPPAPNG